MGLVEFLEHYKTKDSKNVTHTSMSGGKWKVPKNEYKLFYKLIRKAIQKGVTIPPITETIGEFHPLILDIDIKYIDKLTDRQYNLSCLKHLTEFLWMCISEVIDIDDEIKYNDVYIMGKSKPYPCSKGDYQSKDGIHLLYPKIILSHDAYKVLIDVIDENQETMFQIFRDNCSVEPSNLDGTLMDGKFSRWQPYGCHKVGEEAYKLEYVFVMSHGSAEQTNPALVIGPGSLYDDERLMIEMSMFRDGLKENVAYTEYTINKLKNKATNNTSNMVNEGGPNSTDVYASYYVDHNNVINPYKIVEEEELKLLTNLCECFSNERAIEYGKWLDVGLALHNTNPDRFLPVWEKFSQKYHKYRDGSSKRNCAQKWASFENSNTGNPLTVGSLRYWANHDDPQQYNKVMIDNLGSQIEKSVDKGPEAHHLIGLVVHKYYQGQFLCVDIGDDWYFFDGNHWKKTLKGHELKKRIHNEIYNIYHEYSKKYKEIMTNSDEDSTQYKIAKENHDRCTTFQKKLLQETYVITLIGALRHLFYKEKVAEEFDSNLHILGVDNGVIDLKDWVFREGRPEDYITKSTNFSIPLLPIDGHKVELPIKLADINTHLSKQIEGYNIFRNDLNAFIQQIIPLDEVRDYALRFLSKCLSGENRDEGFYIWTGSGGNGKSKLIELMQLVLGDYAGGLSVSLITGTRSASNSATPEMARTKGLRFVVMQEPEADQSINIGLMKELTGNDKIIARGLFKEPIEFIPQFKMLLMCNDLPNIPTNDDGTWRRLEVVDFIARFVDDESILDDSKHVYKRDKELKGKLYAWKLVFFGLLLEEWMKYDKEGIIVPKQVNNKTKSYRNDNVIVGQWIDQSCEITDSIDQGNGLELAPTCFGDLWYQFKNWCQDQGYPCTDSHKKKTKDDLIKWQEKSKYGISIGQNMKAGRPNGSLNKPYFNLTVIQDE